MLVRTVCLVPLVAIAVMGQSLDDPHRESVAAMEVSIARQQESVARQLSVARPVTEGFFHASWPMGSAASLPYTPAIGTGTAGSVATSDCTPIPPSELQAYVEEVSEREGLSPDLLRAVIQRESAFNPCAVSRKGAQGLMQIMPDTGADLGLSDPFDPWENIDAGARFLGQLLSRYGGDIALALGAYNAGPTRVDRYEGLPPIPETLNYVSDIIEGLRVTPLESPPGPAALVVPWEISAPLNIGGE